MILRILIKVAVCAVTLIVLDAELFSKRTAEAQSGGRSSKKRRAELLAPVNPSSDTHLFRPGIRNSIIGRRLDTEEMNLVVAHLRHKTGFTRMRFDEAGFLRIDDRTQIAGGSKAARDLLLAAVDGENSINLQSHNHSPRVKFGRLNIAVTYSDWRSNRQINTVPIEIDFADFDHLRGHRRAVEAFDPGFVILHELSHSVFRLKDPEESGRAAGDCESYINRIRRELGMPERQIYAATAFRQMNFTSGPVGRIVKLVFVQSKPGRRHESRGKTRLFYLMWDSQMV